MSCLQRVASSIQSRLYFRVASQIQSLLQSLLQSRLCLTVASNSARFAHRCGASANLIARVELINWRMTIRSLITYTETYKLRSIKLNNYVTCRGSSGLSANGIRSRPKALPLPLEFVEGENVCRECFRNTQKLRKKTLEKSLGELQIPR